MGELEPTTTAEALVRFDGYASRDRDPAAVYLASLSSGSRPAMRQALEAVAEVATGGAATAGTIPWHALRYQHTAAIRSALSERYAARTVNKALSALRGVLREAWRLGYMDAEAYQRAVDLPAVKHGTGLAGRALTTGEVGALFQACDDGTPAGDRDAALLALLYGGGLRRFEAAAADLGDLETTDDGWQLRVRGKGKRDRIMPIANGSRAALEAWIERRGGEPGPLLCPVRRGGTVVVRRMSCQAVLNALAKRAAEAKVDGLSPHDLRRSSITHLLDGGVDALTVQKLAGHANTQTTLRYDRRDERAKRRGAEALHVPYVARRVGDGTPEG